MFNLYKQYINKVHENTRLISKFTYTALQADSVFKRHSNNYKQHKW